MPHFDVIAFDADDTLWETEKLYIRAQQHLKALLSAYLADDRMDDRLYATEMRNLEHFGYGIKAFALSMIETAIELTGGRVTGAELQQIIDEARQMISADVELLDQVDEALSLLSVGHELMLITKGDLRDQESKLARSGLGPRFRHVEIVSDKSRDTYRAIMQRHHLGAESFIMVGNSLRSDVLPVLELGGSAVYIPHQLTWAHETAEEPDVTTPGFHRIDDLGKLPTLIAQLESKSA